jgi:hypothetical protein
MIQNNVKNTGVETRPSKYPNAIHPREMGASTVGASNPAVTSSCPMAAPPLRSA